MKIERLQMSIQKKVDEPIDGQISLLEVSENDRRTDY